MALRRSVRADSAGTRRLPTTRRGKVDDAGGRQSVPTASETAKVGKGGCTKSQFVFCSASQNAQSTLDPSAKRLVMPAHPLVSDRLKSPSPPTHPHPPSA
ncbi:unnamed protein product [Protopolystoma xenopodis]|uniref:Uncharacterized protein n=1 Tax=Protopolystoma xenopodis TaxID=117903 RepID=A0A448WYH4_9PLAT|nr:unnamed protein product [Protopolystoma xenopodis]